ncbi:dihydroorotate dehydrogenase, partial [Staphylococcus aureus]
LKALLPAVTETFDGIILENTTRQGVGITSANKGEEGGLSGRALFERNLELIKHADEQTNGAVLIIGTGGVFSNEDAINMMRNG